MSKPRGHSVTIRSVAHAAGVSVATVSRVMAGSDKVRPERREQVLDAARRLGYRPNPTARSLSTGTTRTVGVVVPDLSNPYFYDVIRGVGRASAAAGYRMVVADSMGSPEAERELVGELARHTDALVLAGPRAEPAFLGSLGVGETPVVMLIGPAPRTTLANVTVDNDAGMWAVYEHLAALGHRSVAYLAGPADAWQNTVRVEAGRRARSLGIDVVEVPAGGSVAAGHDAVDRAMRSGPTALTCFNDLVALGAVHRLQERGVRVPADVSVTGFDDIEFSAYVAPRLTTVRTPREELGRAGWAVLADLLAGGEPDLPGPLAAELVVRDSTGPAGEGQSRA